MDNVIKLDFIDELRIEGINYKGYGVLPKYVMIDGDLTIEAKGIYAYFCSYAGAGNTAFPSRDKIIADLMVNKDTYYKHFNILTLQGYISVSQLHDGGGRGNGFAKNVYTLIANPKKFIDTPEDTKHNQAYIRIRFGGLTAAGFGFIPKAVMLDTRLDLKAKAIYAYFCSFMGSGNTAFPKVSNILHHLGLSKNTYYRYFRELQEGNYITTVQRHIDGRLSINDYYLNNNPDIDSKPVRTILNGFEQCTNFSDTQIQCTKKQDTQKQYPKKQDTQKPDTNNNNINNNNNKINQSINQQESTQLICQTDPERIEGVSEYAYKEFILKEILQEKTLPYSYLANEKKLTTAIHIMTEWELEIDENRYTDKNGGLERSAFITFNEALIEMLTAQPKPMKLRGGLVTYSKVYDRLKIYVKIYKNSYGDVYPTIYELQETAINDFILACRNTAIKNHFQYMKAVIWNALLVSSVAIDAAIERDFR